MAASHTSRIFLLNNHRTLGRPFDRFLQAMFPK